MFVQSFLNAFVVVSAFSAGVLALPEAKLSERGTCNRDLCLRGVSGNKAIAADCASFLAKTVSICPTLIIDVVSETAPRPTVTELRTLYTATWSTTTLTDTITVTQRPISTVTYPVVTITVTSTRTPVHRFGDKIYGKRDVADETGVATLEARDLVCTTTISPSAVPSYAAACSGTARFSSACACLSITAPMVTLPRSTIRSTVTTTITPFGFPNFETIYTTSTISDTWTNWAYTTTTTIIPTTVTIPQSTTTVTAMYTQGCSYFTAQFFGEVTYNGWFLDDSARAGWPDQSRAATFHIDDDGTVHNGNGGTWTIGQTRYPQYNIDHGGDIWMASSNQLSGQSVIHCELLDPFGNGLIGFLSCNDGNGARYWRECGRDRDSSEGRTRAVFLRNPDAEGGCTNYNLFLRPAC